MSEEKNISLADLIKKESSTTPKVEEQAPVNPTVTKPVSEETSAQPEEKVKGITLKPGMAKGIGDSKNMKTVDVHKIAPSPREIMPEESFRNRYGKLMDENIDRVKNEIYEDKIKPYIETCKEIAEEKEFEEETPSELTDIASATTLSSNDLPDNKKSAVASVTAEDSDSLDDEIEPTIRSTAKSVNVEAANIDAMDDIKDLTIDESDFTDINDNDNIEEDETTDEDEKIDIDVDDAEEDKEPELTDEEKKKEFEDIQNKIKKSILEDREDISNISSFKIAKSPISINKAMSTVIKVDPKFTESQSTPLYNTGKTISFTPLTGTDIVKMSSENYSSQLETYKKTFATMYSHDVTLNKPKSFTAWLKNIDAGDVLQMYFGLYKSTFGDSNYIGYQCPKCKSFFMQKHDIDDMWEYNENATDAQKKRFETIATKGEVEDTFASRKEMYKLSDNYIVELHPRSLYNLIEMEYLDADFKRKYASVIQPAMYINKVYFIDKNNGTLRPIDLKADRTSMVKTIKHKCLVIYKLISSIESDDYSLFNGKLSNLAMQEIEAANLLNYYIPEQKCLGTYKDGEQSGEACTNVIKKESFTPYQMLFTRHQLVMQSILHVD